MKKTALLLCIMLLFNMFLVNIMAAEVPEGITLPEVITEDISFTANDHGGVDMANPTENTGLRPYAQTNSIAIRTSDPNSIDEAIDKRVYYKMDLSQYSDKIIRSVVLVLSVGANKGGSFLYINPVTEEWDNSICYNNMPEYNSDIEEKHTLTQSKICEIDISNFVDENLQFNIMLTSKHPSNADFASGANKYYSSLGGILAADKAKRTYVKVTYTDDYVAPKAVITKLEGDNIQGEVLETDYAYYSYEGDDEGESFVEWLISDNPDDGFEPITDENEKKLTLTEDMANKYIRSAVTPKSVQGVYKEGQRVVSEKVIGPVFGYEKIAQTVNDLNLCSDLNTYRSMLEEYHKLFGIRPSVLDVQYGAELVNRTLSILMNYTVPEKTPQILPAFERALMLANLNMANIDTVTDILKDELFKLDINEYELLKDAQELNNKLINRNFTSLEEFDKEFTNLLAYYRFKESDRTNVKELLKKYDDLFDEDISSLDDDLLSKTGIYLLDESFNDITTLNASINTAVSKAKIAAEEENRKDNSSSSSSSGKRKNRGGGSSVSISSQSIEVAPITKEPIPIEMVNVKVAVSNGDFDDIDTVPWAKNQITKLAKKGIINGVGGQSFAPDRNVTREEFAKMLSLAFSIDGDGTNIFSDVNTDEWYASYIGRLTKNGIVNGVSDTVFGVGRQITREEMTVMVYRTLVFKGVSFEEDEFIIFEDDLSISDYAYDMVSKMAYAGIISGFEDGTFKPEASSTRAMAAVVICNALDYITEG